jgi:hypothetical protein
MSHVDPRLIADMITDDPNVVREMVGAPSQRQQGQYQDDEVPLIPTLALNNPKQIYGSVLYTYSMLVGQPEAASVHTPGSPAKIQITGVQAEVMDAYDSHGRPVPTHPQFSKGAEDYFWRSLLDRVEMQESEKMGSGGPQDPNEDLY